MASHTSERGGNDASKAPDRVKASTASPVKGKADAIEHKRRQAGDGLDEAADAVGEKGEGLREPAARYARNAQEKLHDAADYVRDTDARQIGRDALDRAAAYPLASVLIVSAVVIGGGFLVATMLRNEGAGGEVAGGRRPSGLASLASGLGPKGQETANRIRDAVVSFAVAKAVDTAEQIFPGFREHFDRG